MFFIKDLLSDFGKAKPSQKLNMIANIFTIIGVSLLTLITKPVIEQFQDSTVSIGSLLIAFSGILFWVVVFSSLLLIFSYTKQFFSQIRYGLFLYYCFILMFWLFGLGMLLTLGFEFVQVMIQ